MMILTVSQLNRYIKALLEEDNKLSDVYLRGEISNFTRHFKSGHMYFTLKDESAAIRAVMFNTYAQDLRFAPENGMSVLLRANVSLFERDGNYQLYVTDLQPDGAGALAVAFEQRKARLAAKGMFDAGHKRALPQNPQRIGVITSKTGAVLQDIIHVITRRYPMCTLVVCPAQVQGEAAAQSLLQALQLLQAKGRCDVIILARGGGSAEDLWAFNDEALATAVYDCKVPVVSAIGHETDYTLCDFTADVRAPTPSAAAELCTPDFSVALDRVESCKNRLRHGAFMLLQRQNLRLKQIRNHPELQSPMRYVIKNQQRLDFLSQSLYNSSRKNLWLSAEALAGRAAMLESLSPVKVLSRGYCVALAENKAVLHADTLTCGQEIELRFASSKARVKVLEKEHL